MQRGQLTYRLGRDGNVDVIRRPQLATVKGEHLPEKGAEWSIVLSRVKQLVQSCIARQRTESGIKALRRLERGSGCLTEGAALLDPADCDTASAGATAAHQDFAR